MVSHTVVASSPVAAPLPAPLLAPLCAPLPPPASQTGTKLDKLFSVGKKRFEPAAPAGADGDGGFDPDAYADMYCRVLQATARGNAIRNREMRKQLEAVREENARMRASLLAGAEEEKKAPKQMRKCAADARKDAAERATAAARTA